MALIVTAGQLARKADLYHQLGQLLTSGIGLIQALEVQERNPPSRSYRDPLRRIIRDLQEGRTFGEAVRDLPDWIPQFDASLLEAGEQSGRLPATFDLLSKHYHERARMARQLIAMCAYPVLVLHVAILIFPLSYLQDLILKVQIFPFIQQKIQVLAPLYALVYVLVYLSQGTRHEQVRATLERFARMVPILGQARHSLALARLAASLEAMVSAGVSIISAWGQAARASGSPALMRAARTFQPRMEQGETPSEVIQSSPEFPDLFCNQYHSGEISGKLDTSLVWLHHHYQDEASRKLKTSIMVFAGILFMGVVLLVAWQVISFYIGYFQQISDAIPA